ncbi:uncharacterized protein LOC115628206 [Scaptodrosophila lebanonensis]|uniref:Uncharacterized protein LOC115628206 n=1 Tax=Drosophila lebanonensis TaxID=7225 RepID=A0A6J2TU11_DROLE|nr:uncharacterized protein LOC115628206 [Scaptodrosophila lebanonensis]
MRYMQSMVKKETGWACLHCELNDIPCSRDETEKTFTVSKKKYESWVIVELLIDLVVSEADNATTQVSTVVRPSKGLAVTHNEVQYSSGTATLKQNTTADAQLEKMGLNEERSTTVNNNMNTGVSNNILLLQMLEENRNAEQKYDILSQQSGASSDLMSTYVGPTSAQLAARQVLPADLPTFSGNPDEWPTFISAFENSSAAGERKTSFTVNGA